MLRSLSSSVSGMRNQQSQLDVISNNIANVNTVGYKSSRVTFEEAMNQTIKGASRPTGGGKGGTNAMQVGLGLSLGSIDNLMSQGNLQTTGSTMDLAIEGNSFFPIANGDSSYYTRDGAFEVDSSGKVVLSTNGYVLQGKVADFEGKIPPGTPMGDISLPFSAQSPAQSTTTVRVDQNLDKDSDSRGTVLTSQRFLAVATDGTGSGVRNQNDYLVNLFNENGESLKIRGGEKMTISGDIIDPTTGASVGTINQDLVVDDETSTTPTTLSDLESAIQTAINSVDGNSNAVVSLGANGNIDVLNNDGSGRYIKNLQISTDGLYSKSMVSSAFKFPILIKNSETGESKAMRAAATEDDTISSLYTSIGKPMGFEGGDTVQINGSVGDKNIDSAVNLNIGVGAFGGNKVSSGTGLTTTANSLIATCAPTDFINAGVSSGDIVEFNGESYVIQSVDDAHTLTLDHAPTTSSTYSFDIGGAKLSDLMDSIKGAFSLPDQDDTVNLNQTVAIDGAGTDDKIPDGSMVIRGLSGEAFALNNITIVGQDSDFDHNPAPTMFNSNMSLNEFQKARDYATEDTSINVFDESGESHVLTVTFTKTKEADTWEWEATLNGQEIATQGTRGKVLFNPDGTPASWTYTDGSSSMIFDPNNGAGLVEMTFDYGKPGTTDGLTQFSSPTTVTASYQNGFTTGRLQDININEAGEIKGSFTNGTSRRLAQIYLARFTNNAGLERAGDNTFRESSNSGAAIFGIPGTSDTSTIRSGALEQSNVDLAKEFTSMITTQRGYQAAARVVTTSDSLLQELVNLVR